MTGLAQFLNFFFDFFNITLCYIRWWWWYPGYIVFIFSVCTLDVEHGSHFSYISPVFAVLSLSWFMSVTVSSIVFLQCLKPLLLLLLVCHLLTVLFFPALCPFYPWCVVFEADFRFRLQSFRLQSGHVLCFFQPLNLNKQEQYLIFKFLFVLLLCCEWWWSKVNNNYIIVVNSYFPYFYLQKSACDAFP